MNNFPRLLRFLAVLVAASTFGLPVDGQTTATIVDANELAAENAELHDQLIKLAIEKEILASGAIEGAKIDVRVSDGIVTLSGSVQHLLAEQIATGIVGRIRGVKSIVDLIEVDGDRRDDAVLQTDIAAALATDVVTHNLDIAVKVTDAVCTLSGEVPTRGDVMLAERVAAGIAGLQQITNELKNTRGHTLSDDVLKKEISDLLAYSVLLDNATITVHVDKGSVTLTGIVSNTYQRSQADQLAYWAGADSVDARGIRVDARHSDQDLRTKRYEHATDEQIRDIIERSWNIDPRLVGFTPSVIVAKGVATLTGTVADIVAKKAAERTARYTIGVRKIDNQIKVEWPETSPGDDQIGTWVREGLRRDPYVDITSIKVDVEGAHVGLYGVVDSELEKEHAEWIAGRQVGVVHIDNSLTVRKAWVHKTDEAIEKDLKERLEMTFLDPDNQVAFKVTNGVALLEGAVDSWFMWQAAVDQAIAAGAREPHVMIDVRTSDMNKTPYYGPFDYVPR